MQNSTETAQVLLKRLEAYIPDQAPLTEEEAAVLLRIGSVNRTIRHGSDIILQGRRYGGMFVLTSGFALRYKIMANGRRQIFGVLLPGDLIGYPATFFDVALYSVTALTNVTVCAITFADFTTVFQRYPRLAMALYWSTTRDTAMLGEHLVDVGRRSAYERLAHFLLETGARLAAIGLGDGRTFELPLTQTKIADVLGLSIPHVNRMLRQMREERLLELRGQCVRILDRKSLAELAEFDESYLAQGRAMSKIRILRRYKGDTHQIGNPKGSLIFSYGALGGSRSTAQWRTRDIRETG